eukprot:jgi/Bigna1/84073/fgenesh1_pg.122_\
MVDDIDDDSSISEGGRRRTAIGSSLQQANMSNILAHQTSAMEVIMMLGEQINDLQHKIPRNALHEYMLHLSEQTHLVLSYLKELYFQKANELIIILYTYILCVAGREMNQEVGGIYDASPITLDRRALLPIDVLFSTSNTRFSLVLKQALFIVIR